MKKTKNKKILIFLVVSLVLHILLIIFLNSPFLASQKIMPKPVWVELKRPTLPDRIVDIKKPVKEEKPEKPSVQSLYNQKVKEETVSTGKPGTPKTPKQAQNEQKKPEQSEQTKEPQNKKPEDRLSFGPPKKQETKPVIKQSPKIPGMPEENNEPASDGGDYLPSYKIGGRTYLNTLANPNIRYFVELKRKFKETFNPAPSLRAHFNEISHGKISVVLGVSVNRQGELASLIIIRPSGLVSYDQEGLRTVRSSAPFSSPPTELLGTEGLLHMAWTFVVYL